MKSFLISIKPEWFYLILIGKKKKEIRKQELKGKIFFYVSKNQKSFNLIPKKYQNKVKFYMGKVAAEFICKKTSKCSKAVNEAVLFGLRKGWDNIGLDDACIDEDRLSDYANGKEIYAHDIQNLKIYDTPKNLNHFGYAENGLCINGYVPVKQPPQNYQYVREI